MKLVVIGASAGGLDPLKVILEDLPPDFDAAVLVIRHSTPGMPSLLPAILERHSQLPVREVIDRGVVENGTVYVAPPGITVTADRDDEGKPVFRLAERADPLGQRRPSIDKALISAADVFARACIGVILSGYLDDGTAGAVAVDKRNGTIVVQSPSDAEQSSMPLAAIHGDSPDFILPDVQIGALLRDLVSERRVAYGA